MKKGLLAAVLASALACTRAYAAPVNIDGVITVSGNTGLVSNNSTVGIYMLKVTDPENIPVLGDFAANPDKENYFEHMGICYPETNGDYTYSFRFNGASGDYQLYSVSENGIKDEGILPFLSSTDKHKEWYCTE